MALTTTAFLEHVLPIIIKKHIRRSNILQATQTKNRHENANMQTVYLFDICHAKLEPAACTNLQKTQCLNRAMNIFSKQTQVMLLLYRKHNSFYNHTSKFLKYGCVFGTAFDVFWNRTVFGAYGS